MPKVPQASDIQVGSFDIGRAAKIDPSTASYIGRAGDALGDAVGSFGAAFAEVANRANEAQSKQSYVDMQMDYLNKAESEYQDMNKTQSWDTQPQRWQGIFDDMYKSDKFQSMPASKQSAFKLWAFQRSIPYTKASARNYQQQRANEFVTSFDTYKMGVAKKFDLDSNPSLNTMTAPEVESLVDENTNLMLQKIEGMSDVLDTKQRAAQTQGVYALSAKIKLDWYKRNDPDNFEKLLDKLLGSYNPGDVNADTPEPTPDENLNIFENQQELDNTENLPNFLGGPKPEPGVKFSIDPKAQGMLKEGNIDINARKVLREGNVFKTEESITVDFDGKSYLIPTVIDGKKYSNEEAIKHFETTGENLGEFKDAKSADAYAEKLHKRQEIFYSPNQGKKTKDGGTQTPSKDLKLKLAPNPISRNPNIGRSRDIKSIRGLIIHETEGAPTAEGNMSWSNQKNTGANYYVGKDGEIYQWAPDSVAMNHVGKGRNGKRDDLQNRNTLSIEIITREGEKPNAKQVAVTTQLAKYLSNKYGFDSVKDVLGHGQVTKENHRRPTEGIDVIYALRHKQSPTQFAQVASAEGQDQGGTQVPQEIQSTLGKVQELVATEPDTPLVSVLTPDERQSLKTLVPQSVPLDKLTVQDAKVLFEGEARKQLQQISSLNDQEAAPQRKAMGLGGTELQLDKPIKVADNSLSFSPLELRSLMKDKDALRIMRRDFAEERKAATQINKGTALEMMQNRALNVLRTGEEPDAKTFNPAIVDKAFPSGSKERFFYENLTKDYKQLSDVFKNYGDKPFGQVEAEYRNREPFLFTDKAKALAEKKFNQLQKMMEEDPAQYAEGSTIVKQIRAQFQNGIPKSTEEKTKLIDARLAAQKAIGVPEEGRSPITDAEAATYASTLANTATVEEIVPVMKQIATSVIQNFGKDRSGIVMKYIMKEYLREKEKIEDVKGWLKDFPGNTIYGPPAPTTTTTNQTQPLPTSTSNEEQVKRIMRQFTNFPQAGSTKPTEEDVMALKNGTMPQREFEKKYNMQPTDAAKYRLYGMRGKP